MTPMLSATIVGAMVTVATLLTVLLIKKSRWNVFLGGVFVAVAPLSVVIGRMLGGPALLDAAWLGLRILEAGILMAGLVLLGQGIAEACAPPKRQVRAGDQLPPRQPPPRRAQSADEWVTLH